jgi:hypothetical protein
MASVVAYLEYNPAMREKIKETVQLVYAEVSTRYARELRSGVKTGVTPSLKDVLLLCRSLTGMLETASFETYQEKCIEAHKQKEKMSELMTEKLDQVMEDGSSEDVRQYADHIKGYYEAMVNFMKCAESYMDRGWSTSPALPLWAGSRF